MPSNQTTVVASKKEILILSLAVFVVFFLSIWFSLDIVGGG